MKKFDAEKEAEIQKQFKQRQKLQKRLAEEKLAKKDQKQSPGTTEKKAVGRPNKSNKDHASANAAEKGTAAGFSRKTFLTHIETTNKIESIAFYESKTVKQVVHEAFTGYVSDYEKKNGPVKVPVKK